LSTPSRSEAATCASPVTTRSSDRPVVAGAPLLGVHDTMKRLTANDVPFNHNERISAHEALRAYTYGSAYASHAEAAKGMIEPGKLADFALLADDPTAVSTAHIGAITVLATFVAGSCTYNITGSGQLS